MLFSPTLHKISLTIAFAMFFSVFGYAQNQLIFKSQYSPEKRYAQSTIINTESTIKYAGSEQFLKKIKDRGIENPTLQVDKSTTEIVSISGKPLSNGIFPLTMEFVKIENKDEKVTLPQGTKFYAHAGNGSVPVIDSIVSKGIEENFKKQLHEMMQQMFTQSVFAEKKLKIGEEFTLEIPMSIPIAGIRIDMNIISIYKLTTIKNDIGYFDVIQKTILKSNVAPSYTINATGNGKGTVLYDIKNNFNIENHTESEMKLSFSYEIFSIDMTTKSSFIQTTTITKN